MKTLFLTSALLISVLGYTQEINKTNDGYQEVVDVELSQKEIHQKINEWVALNYKSAQDVIQLNTEDAIILKGNFSVNFRVQTINVIYRINNTLKFSIRDGKYKVDLVPNSLSSDTYGDMGKSVLPMYITPAVPTISEYAETQIKLARETFLQMGYSEKKTQKNIDKLAGFREAEYANYLLNKQDWDNQITSTFQSIKDFVSQSNTNDDW